MILLYIYMYIKTCGWNVAIIRTGMRSTYAANAGRAYAWSVYVDPLPVCREGYQSQPGRILWRKLTCLFVFICLFFAGVVFGLSSVYVQGGNRISTMFSALTVRNIMPGVPSGCFTGSFWVWWNTVHGIPFFTDILIVGAHAALSSWVNLWARLCQTFHYSFPGGCEPSDYMDMLPLPSAVKEAPVLQEEYIPLSSC